MRKIIPWGARGHVVAVVFFHIPAKSTLEVRELLDHIVIKLHVFLRFLFVLVPLDIRVEVRLTQR